MERRFRGATILAVIAIAVIAFIVWGLPALTEGEETPTPGAADTEDPLFPEASMGEVVTFFRVTDHETGKTVAAELDDASGTATNWTITEAPQGSDTGLGVDADRILMDVWYLPTLTPTRVLSNVEALASYGLGDPRYTVEFATSGDHSYEIQVGGMNPGETAFYAQIPGSDNVYLIPASYVQPVLDFVENPPFKTPTPDPNVTPSSTLDPIVTPSATPAETPTPTQEAEEEELGSPEPLFPDSEEATVASIRITDHRTDDVIAAEVGDSPTEWVITEAPEGVDLTQAADATRIIGEAFDLPGLEGRRVESPVDLDSVDLDEPRYTIEFTTSDGEEHRLDIGEESDDDEDYYVLVNEDGDEVYRVSVDVIDPLLDWLDNPPFGEAAGENDNTANDNG